ncbi:FHA domain-containing protein [Mycobacterium sp. 663a-19]|uniref:FHA domain-containing protein n=1 Tax=Mycobacterium sp. 663a-19 TaxID=2986148 RepID=UPI002D1E7E04|nr:FHA domain-containing protein [Mycobacterium sp. 663a-19]MEB3982434.1 FHA domain-containing protein [Mycobacterium sp. 663a-19]
MPSHLEVWKPSGRELVALSGERVTVGKAPTNAVSLEHDTTVSRVHAVLENFGQAWSVRDLGSRNGTYVNGERIVAERILRSGDELRLGSSRLVFWMTSDTGDASFDQETETGRNILRPPRMTPRELDVLKALCRPFVSDDPFPEPASVRRIAEDLFVTEAAVKQHLQHLYDKFGINTEGDRRVRLANAAIRLGAVNRSMLRDRRSQH